MTHPMPRYAPHLLSGLVALLAAGAALGHGDVQPQPVDVTGLPVVGTDWVDENPYRSGEAWAAAVRIGDSAYNQNCARCHGLGAVSGGIAPDLRYLSADSEGDEWFVERFRLGYAQNGVAKMPAFGELLGQEAAWAIRTFIETRPDDGALDAHAARLKAIRDTLAAQSEAVKGGRPYAEVEPEIAAMRDEMAVIAASVATASGAPLADSPVSRAALILDGTPDSLHAAANALTIGLSAAE